MKKWKVVVSLVMVMAMSLSLLSGCAKKDVVSDNEQTTSETPKVTDVATNEPTVAPEKEEMLEFDFYLNYGWWTIGNKFDETNKISKWIMDNKNVKINFLNPGGDANEKLNLMIVSDTLPDVILMERDSMAKKLIELGKVVPLDEFIEKYSGYKSAVDEETRKLSQYDGQTYNILNWPTNASWSGVPAVYFVNEKIYKDMGSPDISTVDGFYNYLKAIKDANLSVDGKSVIPLQFKVGDMLGFDLNASFLNAKQNLGLSTYRVLDGKLKYAITDPDNLPYYEYMNKLYNEGLINQDAFVEKQEQVNEKLQAGRVAVYFSSGDRNAEDANRSLKERKSDIQYVQSTRWPAVEGKTSKDIIVDRFSKLGWNAIYITTSAKDPERIYEYFDWAISPEGQRVLAFGPEGERWEGLDENEYPILKEGSNLSVTEEEKVDLPINVFQIPGNTSYYDQAKIAINGQLPSELKDDIITQQANNLLDNERSIKLDTTQFEGMNISIEQEEFAMSQDIDSYIKQQHTRMITEKDPANIAIILQETIAEIQKKGSEKVEAVLNPLWEANKTKMGIQ